tara:strand:- start:666 stop:893 length:228 start_codon:yes stop_codon:yes gene_type:complete
MEKMPVFVKIEEYEEVVNTTATLKARLASAMETLNKINQLKQEEDAQLQSWQSALSEIENRVSTIENSLHEPERF